MSPEESEAWWDMYQLVSIPFFSTFLRCIAFAQPSSDNTFLSLNLQAPGGRYEYGYNEDQGDKILWKSHTPKTIPRVPRK